MKMQQHRILLVLFALMTLALSASPPSFCKCTCFTNSTIIELGPEHSRPNEDNRALFARAGGSSSSCSKCNRAFCLSYNIPICKGAEEKDVFTTCFQRDSRKDQIIVLLFIAATAGLLGWAAVKQVLEKRPDWAFHFRRQSPPQPQAQYERVDGS